MSITATADGASYSGIDTITVGGKTIALAESGYVHEMGYYLKNDGSWLASASSAFTSIPVNGGETFTASGTGGRIAILTAKPAPTENVSFATGYTAVGTNYTHRNQVTLPDDARYIFIQINYGSTTYTYDLLEVDGVNVAPAVVAGETSINATVDGTAYNGIDTITVGGKTIALVISENEQAEG